MLTIYIARHGQNEDTAEGILNGRRDRPLTALGRRQAEQLAAGISSMGLSFDTIYSSPLYRAYETAEIVSAALGMLKPLILRELIERDFGIMTGKLAKDIEYLCAPDILKTETVTYFLSPDGAETFPVLFERGQKVLSEVQAKHADGSILLVAHGDIGKMIYAAYYGLDWKETLTKFHFGNSELLLLSQDSHMEDFHALRIEQYNH